MRKLLIFLLTISTLAMVGCKSNAVEKDEYIKPEVSQEVVIGNISIKGGYPSFNQEINITTEKGDYQIVLLGIERNPYENDYKSSMVDDSGEIVTLIGEDKLYSLDYKVKNISYKGELHAENVINIVPETGNLTIEWAYKDEEVSYSNLDSLPIGEEKEYKKLFWVEPNVDSVDISIESEGNRSQAYTASLPN